METRYNPGRAVPEAACPFLVVRRHTHTSRMNQASILPGHPRAVSPFPIFPLLRDRRQARLPLALVDEVLIGFPRDVWDLAAVGRIADRNNEIGALILRPLEDPF